MSVPRAAAAALLGLLAIPSCSKQISRTLLPNQPPEVRLERVHADVRGSVSTWSLRWSGSDPDGRIDHYVYAVDPASVDRVDDTWIRTKRASLELSFRAPRIEGHAGAREPHVFAIRAVDEQGAMSDVVTSATVEGNQPPTISIVSPQPSSLYVPIVPPTLRITWQGNDPDPVLSPRPVKYKWIVLSPSSEFPIEQAIQNPTALRDYYAPAFAGWDSTGRDSTAVTLTNMVPDVQYLFVVIAFDELGDYSPLFSLNSNMLRFRVGHPGTLGPRLTVSTSFLEVTVGSGMATPPVRFEAPAGQPLTVSWTAVPPSGADLSGYRWVVDPVDLNDETPRSGPADIHHWSAFSLNALSATLGPYPAGRTVRLYIDARDSFGSITRALVEVTFVDAPPPSGDLLIVDDTRFRVDGLDRANPPCTARPQGTWPTAAELDTFLYARGGVPWRCYPAGTLSPPGVLAGYDFDTLGTRGLRGEIPLSTLSRYRHVIWMVDAVGASYVSGLDNPIDPQTLLRWMSTPGRLNTLAQYAQGGGKVWLLGAGGPFANLMPMNWTGNDQPTITFSSLTQVADLRPGQMMYDLAAWRSEIRTASASAIVDRFGGRLQNSPAIAGLPARMEFRTAVSDPLPPLRTNPGQYYTSVGSFSLLQRENVIVEGGTSTLDTLYQVTGSGVGLGSVPNVVMTRRHGSVDFITTGFDFHHYKRAHIVQLFDWVLREQWGLSRSGVPASTPAPPNGGGGGGPISRIGN